MPVAVNGNVNGAQLWIADHHWWDYPTIWKLPKRPEDGQLDWGAPLPPTNATSSVVSQPRSAHYQACPRHCRQSPTSLSGPQAHRAGDAHQVRYAQ